MTLRFVASDTARSMPSGARADAKGFAPLAAVYDRTRPGYPIRLLDVLARHVGLQPGDSVAEIGAGTGRFTRLLAGRELAITALEPLVEMRSLCAPLNGVTWTEGTFEQTGLPDTSQAWVKRVIGLPGDTVQMRDGQLWINGAPVLVKTDGFGQAEDESGTETPAELRSACPGLRPGPTRLVALQRLGIAIGLEPLDCAAQRVINRDGFPSQIALRFV